MDYNCYIYSLRETNSNSLVTKYPYYLKSINDLIKKDTPQESICNGDNIKVIDMDRVEKQIALKEEKRSQNSSVDGCFVAISPQKEEDRKVVLIELKINVNNPLNYATNDLLSKFEGSQSVIQQQMPTRPIYHQYFIVVNDKMIEQANRIFLRIDKKLIPVHVVIKLSDLYDRLFNEKKCIG